MRPRSQIEHGLGSGVIISPDGYIVTNNHVIDGAVDIRVTMTDRRILPAKLVGADPLTDLAVIKIEGSNFPSVPLGDSTKLHPGQTVLAFGNPLGFRFTVTRGIVSALNRPNPYAEDRRSPGEFIQTDAAINQGNSGGPLVNAHGEVIGINTFLISQNGGFSGMGFAIPTQIVRPTVDSLIKYGKIKSRVHGRRDQRCHPRRSEVFPREQRERRSGDAGGAELAGAKAGLKVGDIITEINGKAVSDAGALQVEVGQEQPGANAQLKALRDGKPVSRLRDPGKRGNKKKGQRNGGCEQRQATLGYRIRPTSLPDARQQVQADDSVHGAIISKVVPGSAADNAGLQPGDIIVEVNRRPVQSASDVQKALSSVENGSDAMVLVWSRGGSSFRVMHPTQG